MKTALPLLAFLALQSSPLLADVPSELGADWNEHPVIAGGEYFTVEVGRQDDSVPLPIPAIVEEVLEGDRLIAPASGDPYFLGFTAGKHFPPEGERLDPELLEALRAHYVDGRPTQETYAFVMFQRRITKERLAQLEELGVRVIEFHPHYCMKVALAPALLDSVAALDFVRWVGAPKRWQKVHVGTQAALDKLRDGVRLDAWISVYDSDLSELSVWEAAGAVHFGGPDGVFEVDDPQNAPKRWMSHGWQQRALEEFGVEVREYVDSIRAFRVRLLPVHVELLTGLDFVQFVEPENPVELGHDESMPMVLADYARIAYDGAATAVAGEVDSGIDYAHQGVTGFFWWGVNLTAGSEATTTDICGHGTHVAGTLRGNGSVNSSYEGAAERVGNTSTSRFFNVKHFSGASCSWSGASLATVLSSTQAAVTDGSGNVTPRPHVINHSWGGPAASGGAFGTEAQCRTIDSSVYTYNQLQAFIAHNYGPGDRTISEHGSAKNAFTIGGVRDYASGSEDPGEMYTSSARGPTGDNRWKPNISAPATQIRSANAGTATGYTNKTGTSMAAPHVSGVAAQLMDHFAFLRHNPTTTGALLMASAMTKNDQLLSAPSTDSAHHFNKWGAGRLDAYKAHYGAGALSFWGWTQGTSAGNYVDVTVNSGATRMAVCLYYHEIAASAGASSALVNDLDLWIDSPTGGVSTTTNTGEYFAQQSSRDNTEIRLLNSPQAGTWRIKVHPTSATSNCRVGLAVLVHYDSTQPNGSLAVGANNVYVQPNQNVAITATAYNPGYVASAVYFDSTSTGDVLQNSTATLNDGAAASFMNNQQDGRDVLVGSIRPNSSRSVTWTTRWATQGVKTFSVNARSDNWVNKTAAATIYVDNTPPPLPTNIQSSTHTASVWSNNPSASFSWSQAADNVSGLAGYGRTYTSSSSLPAATQNLGAVTSTSTTLSDGSWYLNLRPRDNGNNWNSSYATFGPIRIDTTAPSQPGVISSSTHTVNVQSCGASVTVNWAAATDALSGISGYVGVWDTAPLTNPTGASNIAAGATSFAQNIGSSTSARYFHLRARDNAGNLGAVRHFGPIFANANSISTYCTGKTNSLGCVPAIASNGQQPSKSAGNFTVTCSNVISQKNGLLFFGFGQIAAPFQGGTMCVSSPTLRTASQNSGGSAAGNDCSGSYGYTFSTAEMNAFGLVPGQLVYCQYWMRDPQSPSTTGLSNALRFTVCQ